MPSDQIVARRVEQDWKAPGITEGDQVGLAGEVLDVEDPEGHNLLASHLRLVYTVSKRAGQH